MIVGIVAFIGYIASIPAANWLIGNVGTVCYPDGACTVPVWPGIECPSGSLLIGFSLLLRDVVQRGLGKGTAMLAILIGVAVAAVVAPPALVVASAIAFAVSEFIDFAIYTPLYRRWFMLAVTIAGLVGLVVDSVLFLQLAFGSQHLLAGLIIGKAEMILVSLPAMLWVRNYYQAQERRPLNFVRWCERCGMYHRDTEGHVL